MGEDLEKELERLQKEKVVSEMTAQIYLSEIRKGLDQKSDEEENKN
jgi:hypothetical protein